MKKPFFRPAGNSLTPVIIIVAALALSAAVFFLFTRKHLPTAQSQPQGAPKPQMTAPASTPAMSSPPTTASTTTPAPTKAAPSTPPPAPKSPASSTFGFARPVDLGAQIARALASGDIGQAAEMAGAGDPTRTAAAAAVLEKITKGMGFKIGPDDKVQILGQAGDATRLSIPLIKPGETAPSLSMQLDVIRDPKTGWKIQQFVLPKELQAAVASMAAATPAAPSGTTPPAGAPPASPGNAAPGAPMKGPALFTVATEPDALTVAHVFVDALLHQDFGAAQKLTDATKVPNQKLAGLCIVFEEGDYILKPSKPLIMTTAGPLNAWVIAQVQSEKLQQATEFGLEMQRVNETSPWIISGLNLSDLLGSFAKGAGKLGVPYTPIVANPRGGESLALYFEYDQAELHPRAQKQLDIVAGLLKANPSRKLRIAGHTDAKGADDYNIKLSTARALSVKLKLAALGVSPEQVVTEGLGKSAPISPNQKADGTDDPEGRSRNRRAEIYLDF
ncbi:MAG: OmpA family protein [Verrucomicrobiaceae bacterium]|nr:OmpA family protein [Verrucomicrobiaceae bacterium]